MNDLLLDTKFLVLLVLLDVTICSIVAVLVLKFILKRNPNFFYED